MKRSSLVPMALAVGALAGLPVPARAQSDTSTDQREIFVELEGRARSRLRLAVPDPSGIDGLSPLARQAAQQLIDVLREDLEASGVFQVQGPEQLSVLELTGDPITDYQLYQALANELLLDAEVIEEPGRLVLEGRVFNLASANSVLGKRYRGGFELSRRIAHTFADEVVFYFTGRRGVSLTSIAFHSDRAASGGREIYLMDYDGFNQRAITAHQTLSMSPDWSPGSDFVAYVSYLAGAPGIHRVELRTGRKAPVMTSGDFNSSPAYSPDGNSIVFSRSVGRGNTEIFLCNADGSNLRRLTNSRGIDTNPTWSPTGREIAFTSSRSGTPQIYVMSAEGADLRRVTFLGRYNDGAAWSPDGTKLAHSARRQDHSFDIAITDLVTLETRYLTEGAPGSHESPSYSPDGKKLVYAANLSSRSGTTTQIFTMDLDGGGRRQLTRTGNNFAPSWSGYPK
ncbi:MAG: hypothetical protein ACE5GX_07005 [Thermoanaerobaculia bacterium]